MFCFRSVFNGLGEIDVRAYAFALAYILTCYSVFLLLLSFFLSRGAWNLGTSWSFPRRAKGVL